MAVVVVFSFFVNFVVVVAIVAFLWYHILALSLSVFYGRFAHEIIKRFCFVSSSPVLM